MNRLSSILMCSVFFFTAPAFADDHEFPGDFTGTVSFVSDYSFRGVSQTDESIGVQAGIDYAHDSGFYAGLWGSNVDFNDGDEASVEIDL